MGVKMGEAFDSSGHEWTADLYHKGLGIPPLKCKFCPASVTHNPSHSRDLDEKSVLVPAYFKLLPGERHSSGCTFAVQQEVTAILRESRDLFESIRDGQYRLRLAMIKDALLGISPKTIQKESEKPGQEKGRVRTTYVKASGKLPGYINSAKRVLKLRALCDDDAEIAKHLELVFEGNAVIHWPQFYFEATRHIEAFNTIVRNTVQHPIALHGYVDSKRIGVGKNGESVLNFQKDKYQQDPQNSENGIGVEISLWAKDSTWFSKIDEGDEIVVLGLWSATRKAPIAAKRPGRYKAFATNKLSVSLVLMAQVAKISTRITKR